MGILIYAESENGKYTKDSFEIASYAKALANKLNPSAELHTPSANHVGTQKSYFLGTRVGDFQN